MTPSASPPVSYELRLFRPGAEGTNHAPGPHRTTDFSSAPPDLRKEALKRRVAEQLIALNPQLQLYQFPYDKIAQFEKLSLEDTRRKYRHLELNGPEGGNGIQMIVWDDDASLTLPFWHEREKATEAFQELWSYLDIVCRETGYFVYDPQMERTLDLSAGCDEVLANYHRTAQRVREALPVNGAQRDGSSAPGTDATGHRRFPMVQHIAGSGNSGTVLVAVHETGAVCGYAQLSIFRRCADGVSPAPVAYLESWYVATEFRGLGIGQQLLEAAEQWAAARGLRELASEAELENEQMIRAHLACGFAENRRAVHFTKPIQGQLSAPRRAHSADPSAPACEMGPDPGAHTRLVSTLPVPDAATARP